MSRPKVSHCKPFAPSDDIDIQEEVMEVPTILGHILMNVNDDDFAQLHVDKHEVVETKYINIKLMSIGVSMPSPRGAFTTQYYIIEKADVMITKGEDIEIPEEFEDHPMAHIAKAMASKEDHSADSIQYWITMNIKEAIHFLDRLNEEATEEVAKGNGIDLDALEKASQSTASEDNNTTEG